MFERVQMFSGLWSLLSFFLSRKEKKRERKIINQETLSHNAVKAKEIPYTMALGMYRKYTKFNF